MQNEATETAPRAATAEISELVATTSGISVTATGRHEAGIGRVDFLLVDLTKDAFANVVDRKDVDYAVPPSGVGEAWSSSIALTADTAYRLFFHVYDRSGVNLVAYERRDFTCT
jgi:hypothetical protein